MAINLNNPYGMVGIQPNIGTITPPPTPAPTIPGFTGFGDRLATIGGFGDDPDELKTQEELAKMTQAQIDQYTKQRKGARRSGVSEALIQFGEALQGKPATENALKRKQALQNMEMQKQYQAEYQAAIQAAEQTNPAQARLLRSLGLPGFVNLQQKRAEQMFLGSDKPGASKRLSVFDPKTGQPIATVLEADFKGIAEAEAKGYIVAPLSAPPRPTTSAGIEIKELVDENGAWIENITEENWLQRKQSGTLPSGAKLQNLGTGTKAADSSVDTKISLFSPENKPFGDKWQATNVLHGTLQNYTNELSKMDEAALSGVAATSNFLNGVIKNTRGFINLASNDTKSFYDESVSKNSFTTLEGSDFTKRLENISNQYNINESQVRDLAYLFAAARGQEGRGLSDKDYENALQIVAGGIGKEGKIKVIESVYNRLGSEVNNSVQNRMLILENQRNMYPGQQRYFDINIGQLKSLQDATPFTPFENPLTQQQTSSAQITNDIPRVRIKL